MINDLVYPLLLSALMFLVGYFISHLISKDLIKRRKTAEENLLKSPDNTKNVSEENRKKFKEIQEQFYKRRKRDLFFTKILFYIALFSTVISLFLYILDVSIYLLDRHIIAKFYMYSIITLGMISIQHIANYSQKTSSNRP